jgi:hypothetical protein
MHRDLKRGLVLRIHLTDQTTVEGSLVRASRAFVHLTSGRIEAGGVLHETTSERVLVPRGLVKLVEVVGQ